MSRLIILRTWNFIFKSINHHCLWKRALLRFCSHTEVIFAFEKQNMCKKIHYKTCDIYCYSSVNIFLTGLLMTSTFTQIRLSLLLLFIFEIKLHQILQISICLIDLLLSKVFSWKCFIFLSWSCSFDPFYFHCRF